MTPETIIDAEVVEAEPATDMVPAPSTNLFAADPVESLEKSKQVATALTDVLRGGGMIANIQRKEYVNVEGWQTLGSMVGVSGVVTHTEKLDNGFMATAEARTMDGRVIGRADALCTRDESSWKSRDDYALLGMAQTRAISRALRGPLGFVVKLAGFEATSAEEVPSEGFSDSHGGINEDDYQWNVLPDGQRFTAHVLEAKWVNARGKDKLLIVCAVTNANGGKDAAEKLWLEPGRADFIDACQFIGGGAPVPVGEDVSEWVGRDFDLTINIRDGKWRNPKIDVATPVEVQ